MWKHGVSKHDVRRVPDQELKCTGLAYINTHPSEAVSAIRRFPDVRLTVFAGVSQFSSQKDMLTYNVFYLTSLDVREHRRLLNVLNSPNG